MKDHENGLSDGQRSLTVKRRRGAPRRGGGGGPLLAAGYTRCSTDEQAASGLGLAAQRATIEAECERRGWELVAIHEDAGLSGKTMGRPGLAAALELVEDGKADALVVAKLDRLSRSLADFARLMERAQARGWNLVALDLGIDLATPHGEFMAGVMASAAQWERRLTGQRTRDALAVKRSQGVRLGRPSSLSAETVSRILAERGSGSTLAAIADRLNVDGVPTSHGGTRWRHTAVKAVLVAHGVEER